VLGGGRTYVSPRHEGEKASVLLEQMPSDTIVTLLLRYAPTYTQTPEHLERLLCLCPLSKRFRNIIQSQFLDKITEPLATLTDSLSNSTLRQLTALESLDLRQTREFISGEILHGMTRLHTLVLPEGPCDILDEDLEHLGALRCLEFTSIIHAITDRGLASLTALQMLLLPTSDDPDTTTSTITDASLAGLTQLHTLHLGCNSGITTEALARLPLLTSLCLGENAERSPRQMQALTQLQQLGLGTSDGGGHGWLSGMQQLHTLALDCVDDIEDSDLQQLPRSIKTLLMGNNKSRLSNSALHGLSQIEYLDEGDCAFSGDALRDLTALKHLVLGTGSFYRDADLSHLTQLETLQMFDSPSVLSHHCFRQMGRLTALDVREVTAHSLQYLTALQQLACDKLSLAKWTLQMPLLQKLTLTRSATLDDVQLVHWTALRHLDLDALVSTLSECALLRLPRLQQLRADRRQLSEQAMLLLEGSGVAVTLY
jgi:hypothetical protein